VLSKINQSKKMRYFTSCE